MIITSFLLTITFGRLYDENGAPLTERAKKLFMQGSEGKSCENEVCEASFLGDIPAVKIANGKWKYVLIDLSQEGEYMGTIVRSYAGLDFHAEMYERAMVELSGMEGRVRGGGRVIRSENAIEIYGYSKTFGRCANCNKEASKMIQKEYPNANVKWSNEGY